MHGCGNRHRKQISSSVPNVLNEGYSISGFLAWLLFVHCVLTLDLSEAWGDFADQWFYKLLRAFSQSTGAPGDG